MISLMRMILTVIQYLSVLARDMTLTLERVNNIRPLAIIAFSTIVSSVRSQGVLSAVTSITLLSSSMHLIVPIPRST